MNHFSQSKSLNLKNPNCSQYIYIGVLVPLLIDMADNAMITLNHPIDEINAFEVNPIG